MARLIFENLTKEQAIELAEWYEGQGEQDADEWFDCHGLYAPTTDCQRKGGFMEQRGDDIIVYTKTQSDD